MADATKSVACKQCGAEMIPLTAVWRCPACRYREVMRKGRAP